MCIKFYMFIIVYNYYYFAADVLPCFAMKVVELCVVIHFVMMSLYSHVLSFPLHCHCI